MDNGTHLPPGMRLLVVSRRPYEKILFTEATRILFFNTPKDDRLRQRWLGWRSEDHRVHLR